MSVAENLMEDAVLTDFDPNMVACGRAVKQTVRLTFGCWRYRGTFEVEVRGNITGLDAIRCAVEILYESLTGEKYRKMALSGSLMITGVTAISAI